jgi:hypothetical protein
LSDRPPARPRRSSEFVATAYRVQTRINEALTDRARRRGWTTAALGYPGYAAQGRARVRGRLLLAPAGTDPSARIDVPGWRRLLTLEQAHGEIDVSLGTTRVRARADEAGLLDVTIPVELPPGLIPALLHVEGRPPVPAPVHVASPVRPEGSCATSTTRCGSPVSGIPSELRGGPSRALGPPPRSPRRGHSDLGVVGQQRPSMRVTVPGSARGTTAAASMRRREHDRPLSRRTEVALRGQ